MFGKASTSYEVQVRREGRWQIEVTCLEQEAALSSARARMVMGGVEEVKVLKYRTLAGLSLETVLFRKEVPVVKDRPPGLGGSAEGAPLCVRADDLCGFEARVVIGRLLGPFLAKFRITPTELLHSWPHIRKLDEQASLLGAALHAVARHHADVHGVPLAKRVRELRAFADVVIGRARDFQAERRRLPPFDPLDLSGSSRAIEAAVGEEGHDAVFLGQLTLHLAEHGSLVGKLEWLLDRLDDEDAVEPRHVALLEGVMADTLGATEVVKELLGQQRNLALGLCVLADALRGRDPDALAEPPSPLLDRVGTLILHGRAPCCRAVLVERLRRTLNGAQPLDRREPKAEALLVEEITKRLRDAEGRILGGAAMEKALSHRLTRHRQTILREQGMHDIADRLSGG